MCTYMQTTGAQIHTFQNRHLDYNTNNFRGDNNFHDSTIQRGIAHPIYSAEFESRVIIPFVFQCVPGKWFENLQLEPVACSGVWHLQLSTSASALPGLVVQCGQRDHPLDVQQSGRSVPAAAGSGGPAPTCVRRWLQLGPAGTQNHPVQRQHGGHGQQSGTGFAKERRFGSVG